MNAVNDFPTWLAAYALAADPNDDPDADGFTNLAEYTLGMVPLTPDGVIGTITVSINNNHAEGSFTLPAYAPPDVTYKVQVTDDPITALWSLLATRTGNGLWSGPATVSTAPASNGRLPVTVIDPASPLPRDTTSCASVLPGPEPARGGSLAWLPPPLAAADRG